MKIKLRENGKRFSPYFKPDFSPETLAVHNYITHLVCFKKTLQEEVGWFDAGYDGAQDFDMILRLTEKAKKIVHIPKILYHWRATKSSTANIAQNKPYAYEAGRRAVEAHIKRIGRSGIVENSNEVPGIYKIKYDIIGKPKVSILIPNKDNIKYLKNCIDSILELTTYENYEIIIIENDSQKDSTIKYYQKIHKNPKVKILKYKGKEFNYSKIINYAVKRVTSDFVVQLNNDTQIISRDWLETFIGYAQFKEIGAVGARLYYKDKSIQHAGIAIGITGIAGNLLVNLKYGKHAYYGFEALTRNVSAVTGACLFARTEIYKEVRLYG